MKVVLIGFMGSGKTSVAKLIAKKLQLKLIEMDQLIVKKSKKSSINEIFSQKGETYFRQLEILIAKTLRKSNQVVISTGGGVVLNKIIIDYLKENNGQIVFLKTSFQNICQRLKNDTERPLFQDRKKAKKLFDFRQPLYKQYADIIISTDRLTIDQVVNQLINRLKK